MPKVVERVTGVYLIRNLVNGKVYVGSTARSFYSRWAVHRNTLIRGTHSNLHLQAAWNKYGREAFEFSVLERCPPAMCVAREQYWIDYYNATSGYNSNPIAGSNLGMVFSETARKNMSEAAKRRFSCPAQRQENAERCRKAAQRPEVKAKASKAFLGKTHSPEARARIAEGVRKYRAGLR